MDLQVSIELDKDSDTPLYLQLYEQLKSYILDGSLAEDYKLPTIRDFAKKLNVNTVTIVNAYKLLEDNKLVYKRVGSGTYVMPIKDKSSWGYGVSGDINEELEYDIISDDEGVFIDFASATPDPELFPIKDFKAAVNEVLERDGGNAFTYQDSRGYRPLRTSLAEYVLKYDIKAEADNIHIISGAQQGIDIVSKALLTNGDYVFVENPTYTGAIAAFKSRGAKIVDIPLLSDGFDMRELEKFLKLIKPKFIYTMPNFQNPTGYSYSERKKNYLLMLCKKYDVKIVEDDYLSDLSFLDTQALPLKAKDKYDKVLYIKSFSKIFMPGLRVGYMIVPHDVREKIINAKYVSDISTSGLMQRVLDIYLKTGKWEKHINYMKREYSLRYYEAVRAARKYLRGASFSQPDGGLNLWIKLPPGVSSTKLAEECKARGILITPGTSFCKAEEGEQHIRISYAAVRIEKISEGISIIGQIMEGMRTI